MSSLPAGAREIGGLSRTLVVWLLADMAVGVLGALVDLAALLQDVLHLSGQTIVTVLAGAGWAQLITFLGVAFMVLKWTYRVYANAQALNRSLPSSPRWAIGWYFVPIANLWKPFGCLRDAWRVSAQPAAPLSVETPALLRGWWALWLINSLVGNASTRNLMVAADGLRDTTTTAFSVVQALIGLALDWVFILIVRRMAAMQHEAMAENVFD